MRLKLNQKASLKKLLLEVNVRDEYKSGISDPTRVAAKAEKGLNKKLREERASIKQALIRAKHNAMQFG